MLYTGAGLVYYLHSPTISENFASKRDSHSINSLYDSFPISRMQLQLIVGLYLCLLLHILVSCGSSTSQHHQEYADVSVDEENAWTEWLKFMGDTSDHNHDLISSFSASNHSVSEFTDSACLPSANTSDIIDGKPWRRIMVSQNGSGDYTTIQKAINSLPKYNKVRVVVCIAAGEYREKIRIPKQKQFITFIGEDTANGTTVVWNDTASTLDTKSGLPLRTFRSATVSIDSRFFVAKHMIFKNDAPPALPGAIGEQGVAFRVTADNAAFYSCKFLGHQDTLYDHKGRHYFKDCFIEGSIDFIFGSGRSLYKNCYVHALSAGMQAVGSVTAQKRNATSLDSGFSFLQCNLTGDGNVYLGRPWGKNSRVVFAYTWMDKTVVPQGWNDWGVASRERSVFYAEYECSGPGANISERVPWARRLTAEEAQPFLSVGFINGDSWLQEF